ncbi:hypothetical protein QBC37DRAFT_373504 [Rhypophila decipiens]|uniref:Uncharacterized protein n=1 Tax=Rhypophila decipiens TaxID=261697 RepID=A0AAN7B7R4_9PEZI|nr:hypothetical protein QBC37DRAFT_373504 [Rhypophila decipiens]
MDNKTRRPRPVIIPSTAATSTAGPSDAADVYMNQRWPNGIDRESLALANPFIFPKKTAAPDSDSKVSLTKETIHEIRHVVKYALSDPVTCILNHIQVAREQTVSDLDKLIEQASERIIIETYANIGMAINQIDQKMRANLKEIETTLGTRLRDVEGETRYEVGKTREMIKDEWDDLREGVEDLKKQMADLQDRLDKIPAKIVDELADKGWVVTDPGSLVFGG